MGSKSLISERSTRQDHVDGAQAEHERRRRDAAETGSVVRWERIDDALSGWFDASEALEMALIDAALHRTLLAMPPRAGRVQAEAESDEGPVDWSFQPGRVDGEGPSIQKGRSRSLVWKGRQHSLRRNEWEGASCGIGVDRSGGTGRAVGWGWSDTLRREAPGPRFARMDR